MFGDSIAWRSHKQFYFTLSPCQAEYLAISDGCQEIISSDKEIRDNNISTGDCTEKDGRHTLNNFYEDLG